MTAWSVSVTMTGNTDTVDPTAEDAFTDRLAAHHGAGGSTTAASTLP